MSDLTSPVNPAATIDMIMNDASNLAKAGANLYNTASNIFSDSRSNVQPQSPFNGMGNPFSQPMQPVQYAYAYGGDLQGSNPYLNMAWNGQGCQQQLTGYPGFYDPGYGMPSGIGGNW